MTATNERARLIIGLHELADLMEANPELPPPSRIDTDGIKWEIFDHNKETLPALIAALPRPVAKDLAWLDSWSRFTASLPSGMPLVAEVPRAEVCTRRVVGKETVVIPATPAKEAVPEMIVERDIVEWDCGSVLADGQAQA